MTSGKFGWSNQVRPVAGLTGAITHQIGPFQTPMYVRSIAAQIMEDVFPSNAICAYLMLVIGGTFTVADFFTTALFPPFALQQKSQILFGQTLLSLNPLSHHFGDREIGPLLIPSGQILTVGISPATNLATGADANYAVNVMLDGWASANSNYTPLYGPNPELKALR